MNTHKHIAPDDMQTLLFGEPDEQQSRELAEHIDHCERCQKALDEMAATPDLWGKAPELITERHLLETVAIGGSKTQGSEPENDAELRREHDEANEIWDYPVDSLLDNPSHPEMMGRIGDYDIEREVGRGGMGVVFKAYDAELSRPVAIKVLAPHLAVNGAAKKRFAREARAAAAVLHPNVIAIHGVSSTDKTPFIVMRYVAGPSLKKLVDQQGPLEEKEIVRIAMQISSGLAAAHSQGLVHRDIKPANILIEANVSRVLITDFGLARAESDASMTRTGWLAGTPNFMSPEQAHGRQIDGRSDIFSLGSVIYFMATGRLPFRAETPMAVLNRICHEHPEPVRQVNSDVSKTLAAIIDRSLAKDPEHRFQSSAGLHQTLEQYLAYLHQPDVSRCPKILKSKKAKASGKAAVTTSSSRFPSRWTLRTAIVALVTLFAIGGLGLATDWFGFANSVATEPANPKPSGSVAVDNADLLERYRSMITEEMEAIREIDSQLRGMDQQLNQLETRLEWSDEQ